MSEKKKHSATSSHTLDSAAAPSDPAAHTPPRRLGTNKISWRKYAQEMKREVMYWKTMYERVLQEQEEERQELMKSWRWDDEKLEDIGYADIKPTKGRF